MWVGWGEILGMGLRPRWNRRIAKTPIQKRPQWSHVMSVRLHLSGIRVRGVLVDSVDRLEVEVESTREW